MKIGGVTLRVTRTRVDDKTVFRRGKSEMPASRIEIEESRSEREDRREATDEDSEERDCDCEGYE